MIKKKPQASVIVAFYNDVQLLELVLIALKNQYRGQFEVLIADDGSKDEAVDQVKKMLEGLPFPSMHLWQPDDGFRKAIIMNRAVLVAKGETLIFIDADCIPQNHFIDDHLQASEKGYCSAGRRVDCTREAINQIDLKNPENAVSRNLLRLLFWSIFNKAKNVEKGLRLPRVIARKITSNSWGIVGCNFSIQKSDLLSVNGFDERHMIPWGAEDSDLQRRIMKFGIKIKNLKFQATMIHLDHSFLFRKTIGLEKHEQGLVFFNQASVEDGYWTEFGISKSKKTIFKN
jgi:glycosyltransferase involved in cell wall biosynthesis